MDDKQNKRPSSGKSASSSPNSSGSPGFSGSSRSTTDPDSSGMGPGSSRSSNMHSRRASDAKRSNSRADPTYGSENLSDSKGKLRF